MLLSKIIFYLLNRMAAHLALYSGARSKMLMGPNPG